jgi:EpsI family protein
MGHGRLSNALLALALLAAGALAWSMQLRPPLAVDVQPLAQLPTRIGAWRALDDLPLEPAVEAELRADFNLERVYVGPAPEAVWLYIGYYGTERGGRPEHTPRGCYPGQGWAIADTRVLRVAPGELRVNEYLVEREGQRQLVHFWYRSHRRSGMLGGWDQNLDRIIGRIAHGRADGALIRVSTPVHPEGDHEARGRLMAFASELDPLLAGHWPRETPVAEGAAAPQGAHRSALSHPRG